jgi:hypothetical protein
MQNINDYMSEGFVHNDKNKWSGNGFLYTAEAVRAGFEFDKGDMLEAMVNHTVDGCILKRTVDNAFGQDSIDNYIGMSYLCKHYGFQTFARNVLDVASDEFDESIATFWDFVVYGILFLLSYGPIKYVYNNINPNKFTVRAWLGRFPHLIAGIKVAAGRRLNLFDKLYTAVVFLFAGITEGHDPDLPSDHDAIIRPWMLAGTLEGSSKIIDLAIKVFKRRATKLYKTPAELLWRYFTFRHAIVEKLEERGVQF